MNVKTRQEIEKRIAKKVIESATAAGYTLRVHDGEDFATPRLGAGHEAELLKAMFTTDEDRLFFYVAGEQPHRFGWVYFVYGNSGWDVVSDYTINLERVLAPANELADRLEARHG